MGKNTTELQRIADAVDALAGGGGSSTGGIHYIEIKTNSDDKEEIQASYNDIKSIVDSGEMVVFIGKHDEDEYFDLLYLLYVGKVNFIGTTKYQVNLIWGDSSSLKISNYTASTDTEHLVIGLG